MSELCNSSTTPHVSKFHTLLLHDIFYIFSFILSHPLYFSYFIFFSPYLLKLLSFLPPLFLTILLLLFTILSLSIHNNSTLKSPESNPGFLLKVIEKLSSKLIQENHEEMYNFEEFEVYKIVFSHHTSMFDNHVAKEILPLEVSVSVSVSDSDSDCVTKFCTHEVSRVTVAVAGEGKLESFLELLDKFENMGKEKKVVDEPPCSKSNKVVGELQKEDLVNGSEATPINVHINDNDCIAVNVSPTDKGGEYTSNEHLEEIKDVGNVREYTMKLDSSRSYDSSIGSYGSMRKEKEWKRTLACKLFEERHNAGGEDGMDSLWEAYDETDSKKKDSKKVMMKSKSDTDAYAIMDVRKNNRKKSGISENYYDFENEEEEEDDDYELTNGKICCLQALKMSSGKMNFGMGKSNFVKISKALKGMGWIHNVSKHGKKR